MSNAIDLLNSLHDSQFINPEEAKEYEAILTETLNKEKECKKNNAFSILNLRELKLDMDKFKTIIEFNTEPEKNDINDKYENSKKMVEEAEANVMIAELYAEGANAALEAATTLINELLTTKASQKQKKNDVEDDSEDDVEDDSEDDVEDDSEDDVEDDSEDDVEDDSEDDVEHDSEDDSENDVENWPRVTLLYKGKNSGSDSGSYSGTNPGSDSGSYSGTNPGSKAPKRQAAIEAKEKIMSQAETEADIKTYPVKKHKATQMVRQEQQIDESDEYDEFNEYD
jgi:hypothetical protein